MRVWETKTLSCEVEFRKLQDQADYQNKVEPLKYYGYLLLSIFTMLLSLGVFVQIGLIFLSTFINVTYQ